eukprot:scaffold5364_cov164-Amphora_coffeaeformis.AAC.13
MDITVDTLSVPVVAPKVNFFQSALDKVTEKAKQQQRDLLRQRVRNQFDLKSWDRQTTGELKDLDRLKVAEIYSQADSVFEWGLGESSYIAAEVGVPRYGGVDSDAVWVQAARDKSPDHFRFHLGDIGPTGNWGRPQQQRLPKAYLNYQFAPLVSEDQAFDVYMVDGRMRMGCALVAFLHASAFGTTEKEKSPLVLIHDYYDDDRSAACAECKKFKWQIPNHRITEVADLIDHSGAMLAVFKRKPGVSDETIEALWQGVGLNDT